MEYLIFAVAALLIIVCLMGKGYLDYKQDQKIFIKKLYENYGVLPEKEYKPEQYATISHYFERHKDGFYVDDITWNDLDMDEIFIKMNAAYSGAGEEYLYYAGNFLFTIIWNTWITWGSGITAATIWQSCCSWPQC